MENLNKYLLLIIILISFYLSVLIYLKYFYKKSQSNFSPVDSKIPDTENKNIDLDLEFEPNVYETEDTRIQYPALPPVNPIVRKRVIIDSEPVNQDLFTPYFDNFSVLDTPPTPNTNELNGNNLIEIPLQMNYPNENEILRSQKILVTDYNKIKYGNC